MIHEFDLKSVQDISVKSP